MRLPPKLSFRGFCRRVAEVAPARLMEYNEAGGENRRGVDDYFCVENQ